VLVLRSVPVSTTDEEIAVILPALLFRVPSKRMRPLLSHKTVAAFRSALTWTIIDIISMLAFGFWIGFFGISIQIGGFGSELGVLQSKIQIRDISQLDWILPKRPVGNELTKSNLKNRLDPQNIAPVGRPH
jgi:hypothetical protein